MTHAIEMQLLITIIMFLLDPTGGGGCPSDYCCTSCESLVTGGTRCSGCGSNLACDGDIFSCSGCYTGANECAIGSGSNTCCD